MNSDDSDIQTSEFILSWSSPCYPQPAASAPSGCTEFEEADAKKRKEMLILLCKNVEPS
jgi:hypothetical protein